MARQRRSALDALNAGALALALIVGGGVGWTCSRAPRLPGGAAASVSTRPSVVESDPAGIAVVRGGDGVAVPVRDYRRIVCLVPELDDAFAELGMVDRLAAISAYSRAHSARARHLRQVPGSVATGAGIEDVLAFTPDLVVVAAFSDQGRSERMRSAGVAVFNIGPERGAADAAVAIRRIAALCGEATLGDEAAARFTDRLAHLADRFDMHGAHEPGETAVMRGRPRACYVSCYGTRLFGGSTGTSYADIIAAAGFADAAAEHGYAGQLDYRIEDLLAISPDVIITGTGMGAAIAALPATAGIPAVATKRIIEIPVDLLVSPGIAILEAAEAAVAARERLP